MAAQMQINAENVAEYFQGIDNHLPVVSEPLRGALYYASLLSKNPALDKAFCQEAGKVVHVTAQLSEQITGPVTIRGSLHPLDWEIDRQADKPISQDFSKRTFTFYMRPEQINETVEFKLCVPPTNATDKLHWSLGNNWSVDLSKYGHIVIVDLTDVSFS